MPTEHYKARYYDPETGRFLQTDPIGYEDQMNLYAYVANDPVNATDPTGEFAHFIVGAAIGFVADVAVQVATNSDALGALKSGDIGGALGKVDLGQAGRAAAFGAVTGGAGALGKVAATGSIKSLAGKQVAQQAGKVDAAARVAAGGTAATLGATAGAAKGVESVESPNGEGAVRGAVATAVNTVSPVPVGAVVANADKVVEAVQNVASDDDRMD